MVPPHGGINMNDTTDIETSITMKEIARQAFSTLNYDKGHHYIVLIDNNYNYDFYADNDTDAIRKWHKNSGN